MRIFLFIFLLLPVFTIGQVEPPITVGLSCPKYFVENYSKTNVLIEFRCNDSSSQMFIRKGFQYGYDLSVDSLSFKDSIDIVFQVEEINEKGNQLIDGYSPFYTTGQFHYPPGYNPYDTLNYSKNIEREADLFDQYHFQKNKYRVRARFNYCDINKICRYVYSNWVEFEVIK